jgi:hypothetical protein
MEDYQHAQKAIQSQTDRELMADYLRYQKIFQSQSDEKSRTYHLRREAYTEEYIDLLLAELNRRGIKAEELISKESADRILMKSKTDEELHRLYTNTYCTKNTRTLAEEEALRRGLPIDIPGKQEAERKEAERRAAFPHATKTQHESDATERIETVEEEDFTIERPKKRSADFGSLGALIGCFVLSKYLPWLSIIGCIMAVYYLFSSKYHVVTRVVAFLLLLMVGYIFFGRH